MVQADRSERESVADSLGLAGMSRLCQRRRLAASPERAAARSRRRPAARRRVALALVLLALFSREAFGDCVERPEGQIVEIEAAACEVIVPEQNRDVQKHVGTFYETWNLKKAYTGALIRDRRGQRWMYPSHDPRPCAKFPRNTPVQKRAYFTCCDSGRWGKCVFGGQWLGDVDGPPINAFQ